MSYSQGDYPPPSRPIAPSAPSAPSAPELPESYGQHRDDDGRYFYANPHSGSGQPGQHYGEGHGYSYAQPYDGSSHPGQYGQQQQQQYGGVPVFPPGTHPDVIRSFEMADRDRSGLIDENELRQALCFSGYENFSVRTTRLLIFLFKRPSESQSRLGPKEFSEVWSCLREWRAMFDRFDRDRSGKMDLTELRDALYYLGYALPPSVLQFIVSKYDDGSGKRVELSFDNFVECGMIVKGLTEKFKEKDPRYSGSATLSYDAFMSMVIPFLVSYD